MRSCVFYTNTEWLFQLLVVEVIKNDAFLLTAQLMLTDAALLCPRVCVRPALLGSIIAYDIYILFPSNSITLHKHCLSFSYLVNYHSGT